jgi:hypothetical protein
MNVKKNTFILLKLNILKKFYGKELFGSYDQLVIANHNIQIMMYVVQVK